MMPGCWPLRHGDTASRPAGDVAVSWPADRRRPSGGSGIPSLPPARRAGDTASQACPAAGTLS